MRHQATSTIAAVATAPGLGGIAVIRISGSLSKKVASGITGLPESKFRDRYAVLAPLKGISNQEIDQGIVTYFQAPRSYTGEDVVEISSHGGWAVPTELLELAFKLGCDPAEPGEFTKRAFLNGKMDLCQAEAVADVIAAKTALSQHVSYRTLSGIFSRLINEMRSALLHAVVLIEAELDFSDDEITPIANSSKLKTVQGVIDTGRHLVDTYSTGKLLRDGAIVSIIGKPNVGKSSILNAILAEQRVIVTDTAGTTRDAVEVFYQINGLPIRFVDTAGLRPHPDPIERRGIEFSTRYIEKSDLILWVLDATDNHNHTAPSVPDPFFSAPYLLVLNKADLVSPADMHHFSDKFNGFPHTVVSALTGRGIDELVSTIREKLLGLDLSLPEAILTNARHKKAIEDCLCRLEAAKSLISNQSSPDLVASELRDALMHLDRILGITNVDDILDNIFSTFCVGK